VMNSYIDQSKNLFVQMQDQMQDQTRQMFSVFPFAPPGKDKKD
ncbi:polyhydroxyalkanoate synthesis repressor PhaR, partial [Providencia rettgeri]|nr:polyhydroxyalkanoate synthesis repressor PhaR [Providencia rettgeri]